MENRRNYYRILHVQPDAPEAVIKSSYRALMLKLEMHPDHGGEHWTATLLNEAYAVLSDPEKRASYDRDIEWGWAPGPSARADDPKEDLARCVFCGQIVSALHSGRETCTACKSPLRPATKMRLIADDRRGADRVHKTGALRYYTEWPQPQGFFGQLEDISPSGVRFVGATEVLEYQIIKIQAKVISATARVVYCRPTEAHDLPFVIGAEFFTAAFQQTSGTFVSTSA